MKPPSMSARAIWSASRAGRLAISMLRLPSAPPTPRASLPQSAGTLTLQAAPRATGCTARSAAAIWASSHYSNFTNAFFPLVAALEQGGLLLCYTGSAHWRDSVGARAGTPVQELTAKAATATIHLVYSHCDQKRAAACA